MMINQLRHQQSIPFRANSASNTPPKKHEPTKTLLLSTAVGGGTGAVVKSAEYGLIANNSINILTKPFREGIQHYFKQIDANTLWNELAEVIPNMDTDIPVYQVLEDKERFIDSINKTTRDVPEAAIQGINKVKNKFVKIAATNGAIIGLGLGAAVGLGVGFAINHFRKEKQPIPVESTPVNQPEPPKPQQTPVDNWSAFSLKG